MLSLPALVNQSFKAVPAASALMKNSFRFASSWAPKNLNLEQTDPEIFDIIEREKNRQWKGLELIASENFTSEAVLSALGSCLNNKYAEGYPGRRYYGGNEFIDMNERLAQKRALEAFGLDPEEWGVNVQPLSGSPANFAAYTGVLKPHDRIMGLDLPHGGHLTHGFMTDKKRVSATSVYFESMPYRLNDEGFIDYDALEKSAELFKPRLIIAGASAYPRLIDYARMKKIAQKHNAYLMADIAHIAGMMSAGHIPSAFDHCDIVTTTTHKTLRGPRGGLVFYRKGVRSIDKKGKVILPSTLSLSTRYPPSHTGKKIMYNLQEPIDAAVFPGLQGGPHEHQIGAIAVCLKEAMSPEFREYQLQVLRNAQALASNLLDRNYKLSSGGTDNHLMLWNLKPLGLTGSKYEKLLDEVHITVNKNSVVGDTSAMNPGGVRLGTAALTSRGMGLKDMADIGGLLHRGVVLAQDIQRNSGKKLTEFVDRVKGDSRIQRLRDDVCDFATQFDIPGFDVSGMKYKGTH